MKNLFWLVITAFIFTYCSNEKFNDSQPREEAQEVNPVEPGHFKASHDAPFVGIWVIEFAIGSPSEKKEAIANEYQGRWFNLKADNTFESGKWQEKNNTGNWNYDAETRIIQLNFDKAEPIGIEWKTQGHGDRLVWLGNTPNNKRGTQLSLNKETVLPQQK